MVLNIAQKQITFLKKKCFEKKKNIMNKLSMKCFFSACFIVSYLLQPMTRSQMTKEFHAPNFQNELRILTCELETC